MNVADSDNIPRVNEFYIIHTNLNEYKICKVLEVNGHNYLVEFSNRKQIECCYAFEPIENITKYYAKNVLLQEDVKAWNMRGKLFGIRMYLKEDK